MSSKPQEADLAVRNAELAGTLRADIKPANIIVGKHGETLVVDWGLAKATGRVDPGAEPGEQTLVPSSSSGPAETLPGRALGTPSFVSPEQAEARDPYDRAIALRERLVAEHPKTPTYRGNLAGSLRRRGLAPRDLGDPARAEADVRRALVLYDGLATRSREQWYETACCHAAMAGLAGTAGSGLSASEAASEADAAVALLKKAVALGYRLADAVRNEPALDPLRNRPDFRLLMMDLAIPAEPFASPASAP